MILKLFLFLHYFIILTSSFKCSNVTRLEIESHLSTKTPYRVISNKYDKEIKFEGCTPIRIWSIIRHGSRNPGEEDIIKCKERLTKIREQILTSQNSKLCPHEFALFRSWNCDLNKDEAKFLVYEGEDELIELAERMQNRFPKLLVDKYNPGQYKFKYTATQRTMKSAQSFATGLFGRHRIKEIMYEQPLHKDPVLRFYKLCSRWKTEVDSNPNSLVESQEFLQGEEMRRLVQSISKKIGVNGLDSNDIMLMYTFCAFETAWNKKRMSPWCLVFDKRTILVPEFVEDLEYYWVDGYGHELTYKQACPAIRDMINHIKPESLEVNATFYFTHSGTILKFLSHLGLYKDDFILKHIDYKRDRKWKTSKIDSFASNIAFVTFACDTESKVLVLHQERIIHLPIKGCDESSGLCSLKKFEKYFEESINNCMFDEICQNM